MTDIIETLPPVLRGICTPVVNYLTLDESDQFRTDLTSAVQRSTADLELVGWRVMHRILLRLPVRIPEVYVVTEGIRKLAEGGEWPAEDAWAAARDAERGARVATRPASWGAWAAANAAWTAGWFARGAERGAEKKAADVATRAELAARAARRQDIRQQAADILEELANAN